MSYRRIIIRQSLNASLTVDVVPHPASSPTWMRQSASGVMSVSVQLGALRTGDLRELLEDEDKINDIIRCDGKVSPREMPRCCICSANDLGGSQRRLLLPGCILLWSCAASAAAEGCREGVGFKSELGKSQPFPQTDT